MAAVFLTTEEIQHIAVIDHEMHVKIFSPVSHHKVHLSFQNLFQREICEREAERLSNMINSGSPLITTNYALSIAKASFIEYPSDSQSSGAEIIFVSKRTVFAILLFTIVQFGK